MLIKQRLSCPKCGEGFIVNPKPPVDKVNVIGIDEPLERPRWIRIPHCDKCRHTFSVSFDFEKLEIEIVDHWRE